MNVHLSEHFRRKEHMKSNNRISHVLQQNRTDFISVINGKLYLYYNVQAMGQDIYFAL